MTVRQMFSAKRNYCKQKNFAWILSCSASRKNILEERLRNAEELAKMYTKRLQTGDANALETNKINLELLNVKTEASLNETALRNKLQELNTLNGNIPVVFEENQYAAVPFPSDYQILKSEVMSADRTLMALWQRESGCSQTDCCQQVSVATETGVGLSTEYRDGSTVQRCSGRLFFPNFRKPE